MAFGSLCLFFLTVSPDRSQFFRYESISLRCPNSSWTVQRTTPHRTAQPCSDREHRWALTKDGSCVIRNAYPADTGEYWCESKQEACRSTVNITVTAGVVILESPPYPVNEGDAVTLRCSYKEEDDKRSTSNFSANFYKDDVLIGVDAAGQMTLKAESKSEGFYKCQHPSKGESLQSWLTVKAISSSPALPVMPWIQQLISALLFVFYSAILVLCVYTYRQWLQARADALRSDARRSDARRSDARRSDARRL